MLASRVTIVMAARAQEAETELCEGAAFQKECDLYCSCCGLKGIWVDRDASSEKRRLLYT